MLVAETCPDCGAIRPSYLGGTHMVRRWPNKTEDRPVCDGRPDEDYWQRHMTFMFHNWPVP